MNFKNSKSSSNDKDNQKLQVKDYGKKNFGLQFKNFNIESVKKSSNLVN
jgi:hypothetical protein